MPNITNYEINTNQNYSDVSYWSERPSSKSVQTINAGKGMEKREPSSYTVGGNVNLWKATTEYSMEVPQKTESYHVILQSLS